MNKNIKWLKAEIDQWVKDGLIETEQGNTIKARYPVPEQSVPWSKIIFSSIGAALLGLGIILFFAYNWEKMHKFTKLAVIFSALITAHGSGIWFSRENSSLKPAGEGLHVLGTMLFGAGIWLIAQVYHIDEHYPNAFFIWGCGASALAWAMPSISQGIMTAVLFLFWNGFEVFDFRDPNHGASVLILCVIMPLAWKLRSRVLTGVGICSLLIAISFTCSRVDDDLILPILFFCSCALIALSAVIRKTNTFPQSAPIFSFIGSIPYWIILYIMTFPKIEIYWRIHFENFQTALYFSITALTAIIIWAIAIRLAYKDRDDRTYQIEQYLILSALIFLILRYTVLSELSGWSGAAWFNVIFMSQCILMILNGCRTVNIKLTTAGCLLFSVLAVARYTDLFESLLLRSLIFLIIGAAIFVVGNLYSKAKKQKQENSL